MHIFRYAYTIPTTSLELYTIYNTNMQVLGSYIYISYNNIYINLDETRCMPVKEVSCTFLLTYVYYVLFIAYVILVNSIILKL